MFKEVPPARREILLPFLTGLVLTTIGCGAEVALLSFSHPVLNVLVHSLTFTGLSLTGWNSAILMRGQHKE